MCLSCKKEDTILFLSSFIYAGPKPQGWYPPLLGPILPIPMHLSISTGNTLEAVPTPEIMLGQHTSHSSIKSNHHNFTVTKSSDSQVSLLIFCCSNSHRLYVYKQQSFGE